VVSSPQSAAGSCDPTCGRSQISISLVSSGYLVITAFMTTLMRPILTRRHSFNFILFRMWHSSGRRETVLSSYVSFVCYFWRFSTNLIFAFNPRQFRAIWYGEGNKARPKRGQRTDLRGGRSVFFPRR